MPETSVIIPYYRKKNFIIRSINSVLNQSYKNFEIIIIYDDENLDDFFFLQAKFKKNKKIRIIKNKKNIGAGLSRNLGIKKSKGLYCAFLDADDVWVKSKLKKQIYFMKSQKYDFTFTSYIKIFPNKLLKINSKIFKITYQYLLKNCPIGLSTVIVKKKRIPKNLFLKTKTQEDLSAWLKITKNNIYAYRLNEYLTKWYSTPNSLSKNFFQKIYDLNFVLKKQKELNFLRRYFYLFLLSLNSLQRKF